jgi:dTDP-4-dehydrorhamnose 3,5-epimerase
MPFEVQHTAIEGVWILRPKVYRDHRGYFMESYRRDDFSRIGINVEFVQDNQSLSKRGTIRGLHFQRLFPQTKLVRVLTGRIYDVAVDLRKNSSTLSKWVGVYLDAAKGEQLLVPVGCAHGFLALSDNAEILYKCSNYYHAEDESGIVWNDPIFNIQWPLEPGMTPTLSSKDQNWPKFEGAVFP